MCIFEMHIAQKQMYKNSTAKAFSSPSTLASKGNIKSLTNDFSCSHTKHELQTRFNVLTTEK
jgi:hypothetical protein